ncbi:MAG: 6-phospho-beta-glucosidase, partial [Enterobacterales bacterium]|nr:6-phospho-beta-glucosidase [Enterobacterales bacterium]
HDLPADAVIETDCIVDAQGAHPLAFGSLPVSMVGLTQQVKSFERLTIEAAVHGDRKSALLALVTNPLIGDAGLASPLLDEVLAVNKAYLPQFN